MLSPYHSLAPMYYRGAQAAIVVYDVTKQVLLCHICSYCLSSYCFVITHEILIQ